MKVYVPLVSLMYCVSIVIIIVVTLGEKVGFIPEMDKREEVLYETPTDAAANYEIPVASGTVSFTVNLILTI